MSENVEISLKKNQPIPGEDGGIPCKLCIEIVRCERICNKLDRIQKTKKLSPRNAKWLENLRARSVKIRKQHPKCVGCSILFGGLHLESPNPSPMGDLCSVCFKYYNKQGAKIFQRRMKGGGPIWEGGDE